MAKVQTKPFDLQAALAGKPVVNGNGKKVTNLVLLDNDFVQYPVVGIVEGATAPGSWTKNGVYSRTMSNLDLYMAVEKVTLYINVYPEFESDVNGRKGNAFVYGSKEDADEMATKGRILTTIEVER